MGRTRLGHVLTGCLVMLRRHGSTAAPGRRRREGKAGSRRRPPRSDERTCLVRAMYFESNRSSRDGLMAVGTVVMNRVASPRYPQHDLRCGRSKASQFADGVLTNSLNPRELPPVERAADAILAGERYKPIGDAMWFHVASLQIPYRVQYMAVAGGNAFYRKTGRRYADIRFEPNTRRMAPARPPRPSVNQAALAEAPQGNVVERFFGHADARHPPPPELRCCESGLGRDLSRLRGRGLRPLASRKTQNHSLKAGR